MKNLLTAYKSIAPRRKKMIKLIAGIVIGAALGFGYYKFVGCSSGTCPITGNPFISTLYGALMGAMLSGFGA
jgi:Family of unknown function (DUF6132)